MACGVMAVAFAVALGGCGSDEEALPEENVNYEIALVTDDSLVMDDGHSETAWNAITEFGGTIALHHDIMRLYIAVDYIVAVRNGKS